MITRHRFVGRRAFEFLTLVSFAIPGTVIGVSYIVAFNVAPLELTGGMAILVLCFVFRNMPVGVRAGVAALAQIDKTLDEASSRCAHRRCARCARSSCRCCGPAILATLVFSFTHAMTAVSAVIFLATREVQPRDRLHHQPRRGRRVSARDRLLVGADRVHAGGSLLMQRLIGEARLGRRAPADRRAVDGRTVGEPCRARRRGPAASCSIA